MNTLKFERHIYTGDAMTEIACAIRRDPHFDFGWFLGDVEQLARQITLPLPMRVVSALERVGDVEAVVRFEHVAALLYDEVPAAEQIEKFTTGQRGGTTPKQSWTARNRHERLTAAARLLRHLASQMPPLGPSLMRPQGLTGTPYPTLLTTTSAAVGSPPDSAATSETPAPASASPAGPASASSGSPARPEASSPATRPLLSIVVRFPEGRETTLVEIAVPSPP